VLPPIGVGDCASTLNLSLTLAVSEILTTNFMKKKVLFILGELEDDDIDWIVATGKREEIPAGETLIHEGKPVDTLYILLDGLLTVSIPSMGDKVLAQLSTGDMVGEMSFVDSRPPSATVKTSEPSLLLSLSRAVLVQRLEQDLGFAFRFYRALTILLSTRLRGTVRLLGYGSDEELNHTTEGVQPEFDPHVSESVALAEVRFNWLLRRLKNLKLEI